MTNHQAEISLPAALLEYTGHIHQITRLAQGTGYPHWRIDSAHGVWVWRQFLPLPPARERLTRELQILHGLQPFTFTPHWVWHDADQGVLFRFAEGITPQVEHISPHARQHLLEHVMTWWGLDIELKPYDYAALTQQYADDASALGADPQVIKALVKSVQRAHHWPRSSFRLTHHDLHAGNLLLHGDAWIVLDWEYAGLANPWVDAVMLDRMLHLTAAERDLLTTALANATPDLGWKEPWHEMHLWLKDLETLWWLGRPAN